MSYPDETPIIAPVGMLNTFRKAGDLIPMHKHGRAKVHIICVVRGPIRIHGPRIGDSEYKDGAIVDIGIGVEHELVSLVDNGCTAHFLKYPNG
jgi:hypothetical protein